MVVMVGGVVLVEVGLWVDRMSAVCRTGYAHPSGRPDIIYGLL